MYKKVLGFASFVGGIALGAGVGCTLEEVAPSDDASLPDASLPDASLPDASLPDAPPEPPPACFVEANAVTGFEFAAPKAAQGICTDAQIDSILEGCLRGDGAKCREAADAAPLCDECITGKVDGPFPAFVTYDDEGNGFVADQVCAGLVLGKPDCGPKVLTAASCVASVCATCETGTERPCEDRAIAGVCKDVIAAVGACQSDLEAGKPKTDPVCRATTPFESLRKVASYLCGSPPTDAGGGG